MIKLTQKEYVKRWLNKGYSITPPQAQSHYNIWRLAEVIRRLKSDGLNIYNIGKPGKQAKYRLIKE
jgi:hypothetical protein